MPVVNVRKKSAKKPALQKPKAPPSPTVHSSGKYKVQGNKVMQKTSGGTWKPKYTTTTNEAAKKLMKYHYGK